MKRQNAQHREKFTFDKRAQKKHFLGFSPKTKLTPTSGSVFADNIEQQSKIELELIRNVDCFLDGHVK